MMWGFRVGLVAVCSVMVSARPAWSDDSTAKQEATARFKTGVSFSYQGKWDKARLSFLQAYAVLPNTVNILWNLAFAELKSGHPIEALQHFEIYETDPKAEAKNVAALPMFRERAYKEIGRIKVEAPEGATVWVDGTKQVWSGGINLVPGEHTVKIQVEEQSEERRVTLSAGQLEILSFTLPVAERASTEGAPPSPDLVPAAVSSAPERSQTLATGPSHASNTWGWIGLGATGVALGVGIGFSLAAHAAKNEGAQAGVGPIECNGESPRLQACEDVRDAQRKHDTFGKLSNAGFVAGGVLGVVTAGYFLLAPRSVRGVSVSPYAGLRQGGVTVRARF